MKIVKEEQNSSGWERAYEAHAAADVNFLWDQRPHAFLEEISLVRKLKDRRIQTILDAGCGDGRNSLHLENCGFTVIGIDVSTSALMLARQRAEADSASRVIFSIDDICALRITGPVDAVLCADCLGQIENPAVALSEFFRVLRPGGVLIANVYDINDGTFGAGKPHSEIPDTYLYKQTLFRYFEEDTVRALFGEPWTNVEIRHSEWFDPPHGEFRPEPHKHSSLVIWAEKAR